MYKRAGGLKAYIGYVSIGFSYRKVIYKVIVQKSYMRLYIKKKGYMKSL